MLNYLLKMSLPIYSQKDYDGVSGSTLAANGSDSLNYTVTLSNTQTLTNLTPPMSTMSSEVVIGLNDMISR